MSREDEITEKVEGRITKRIMELMSKIGKLHDELKALESENKDFFRQRQIMTEIRKLTYAIEELNNLRYM